ncbi:hypothetical protein RN38_11620 [Hafnia paralvei]|nr:hypothetical protein RN38_11620 [Hafnia paralvei]
MLKISDLEYTNVENYYDQLLLDSNLLFLHQQVATASGELRKYFHHTLLQLLSFLANMILVDRDLYSEFLPS